MNEPVEVEPNSFITLYYKEGGLQPFIRWIKDGVLVANRPAFGAEEKLLKLLLK